MSQEMPVSDIYRLEDGWRLIEMRLEDPSQLLNSLDPSPFRQRDLDGDAARYLSGAIRDLHGHKAIKLVIWLDLLPSAGQQQELAEAVGNYFSYQEITSRQQLRNTLRTGRTSLVVGLTFLFFCTSLWKFVLTGDSMLQHLLSEGLLIIGWVAMWRPLEILLYEWWPVLADIRMYRHIQQMPVEIRSSRHNTGHALAGTLS